MKIQLKTEQEVQSFRTKIDSILGYPNKENGTETYCNIPELTEIKDNEGNVVDSYYEIDITDDLNTKLVEMATKHLISDEVNTVAN